MTKPVTISGRERAAVILEQADLGRLKSTKGGAATFLKNLEDRMGVLGRGQAWAWTIAQGPHDRDCELDEACFHTGIDSRSIKKFQDEARGTRRLWAEPIVVIVKYDGDRPA